MLTFDKNSDLILYGLTYIDCFSVVLKIALRRAGKNIAL